MNRSYFSYSGSDEKERKAKLFDNAEVEVIHGAEVVSGRESFGIDYLRDIANPGDTVWVESLAEFGDIYEQISVLKYLKDADIKVKLISGIENELFCALNYDIVNEAIQIFSELIEIGKIL